MVSTLHNVITLKSTKHSIAIIITLHSHFITLLDWLHYTQITLHPAKYYINAIFNKNEAQWLSQYGQDHIVKHVMRKTRNPWNSLRYNLVVR